MVNWRVVIIIVAVLLRRHSAHTYSMTRIEGGKCYKAKNSSGVVITCITYDQ